MSVEHSDREQRNTQPTPFMQECLAQFGVETAEELTTHQKMQIALEFQLHECGRDEVDIAPQLKAIGLDEAQIEEVLLQIGGRGGRMLRLIQDLLGYRGELNFSEDALNYRK